MGIRSGGGGNFIERIPGRTRVPLSSVIHLQYKQSIAPSHKNIYPVWNREVKNHTLSSGTSPYRPNKGVKQEYHPEGGLHCHMMDQSGDLKKGEGDKNVNCMHCYWPITHKSF